MLPITGIEDELGEGWARGPCSQVHREPRMSFTEEPTHVWEVASRCRSRSQSPAMSPLFPNSRAALRAERRGRCWRWFEGRGLLLREAEHFEVV